MMQWRILPQTPSLGHTIGSAWTSPPKISCVVFLFLLIHCLSWSFCPLTPQRGHSPHKSSESTIISDHQWLNYALVHPTRLLDAPAPPIVTRLPPTSLPLLLHPWRLRPSQTSAWRLPTQGHPQCSNPNTRDRPCSPFQPGQPGQRFPHSIVKPLVQIVFWPLFHPALLVEHHHCYHPDPLDWPICLLETRRRLPQSRRRVIWKPFQITKPLGKVSRKDPEPIQHRSWPAIVQAKTFLKKMTLPLDHFLNFLIVTTPSFQI